ncbi:hypothetical protein [Deinococcus humi]|uniref:Uncharacterized protein n=1 Tax=Deinococcus humi TaxID=662880 RepID=A0A7W8NCG6_9DEIO|nr:hypothetical protein [Deinococcus humi]MBB5361291.1 hypothetical protein [Deinococcus humi]
MRSKAERRQLLINLVQFLHRAAVLAPERFKHCEGNHFQVRLGSDNYWVSVHLQWACADTHGGELQEACVRTLNERGIAWQMGNILHGPGPQEYAAAVADEDGEISPDDWEAAYPSAGYALLAAMVYRLEAHP